MEDLYPEGEVRQGKALLSTSEAETSGQKGAALLEDVSEAKQYFGVANRRVWPRPHVYLLEGSLNQMSDRIAK